MAYIKYLIGFILVVFLNVCSAQQYLIKNNTKAKTVAFGNAKIRLTLDYGSKASITSLIVNGQPVISSTNGIYSEIKTASSTFSSLNTTNQPSLILSPNAVKLTGISYGDEKVKISEVWTFKINAGDIKFSVDRSVLNSAQVEEVSFPCFNFDSINTWEGSYQGYGGLAWFYLFNEKLATYGVHTNSSKFWNSKTGNGLNVIVDAPGKEVAMKYSRTNDDKLLYAVTVSNEEMLPRYDKGTNRKRFIRKSTDIWSAFTLPASQTSQSITLSYFDFNKEFNRGKFVGMNGAQISSVLNTIARIGVIDKKHFGGNSWHTPYGPICLHEQYIAQLGLAINDNTYLKGYQECLDFYRDNAIKPDGRVWPRWAYNNVDIMPGEVTDKGFYEAQWGYLLDSNPDFVTNVSELYDQTGDKTWVKSHQLACEKALDWIIRRDSDGDGLVEMITDSYKQKRGSDWIDIIWAAYENAFVNAKLYFALTKWADIEQQLGNQAKASSYRTFAAKLKSSFNKPTTEGGLWDADKKCYVHWRDKDNSIHGNNMVTPVNFMAIAYGLCEDPARKIHILDEIENQMQREKLFFWPLNLYSYQPGEGNDWQFPFPAYENGDIFLSWGAVAVKAYADYKPELALKYVRNVMSRHHEDGLAFQRYGRDKQNGLGDDILSGNSLSVVGLYQAIYGINPLYNRFYLNPHITPELSGTELNYNFRDQKLKILLLSNLYSVDNGTFKISSDSHFGYFASKNELQYFNGTNTSPDLTLTKTSPAQINLKVERWLDAEMLILVSSKSTKAGKVRFRANSLKQSTAYQVNIDGKKQMLKSDASGSLLFEHTFGNTTHRINILAK